MTNSKQYQIFNDLQVHFINISEGYMAQKDRGNAKETMKHISYQ